MLTKASVLSSLMMAENDVFVHVTAVQESGLGNLDEGDRVSFRSYVENRGKMAAANLTTADAKEEASE